MDLAAVWQRALSADEVARLSFVPEPSAFALLAGVAAMGLVLSRFRRKRSG
jgi:hypothetical protein